VAENLLRHVHVVPKTSVCFALSLQVWGGFASPASVMFVKETEKVTKRKKSITNNGASFLVVQGFEGRAEKEL
jgi:hypothetical protein